jgi:hypothetical protein
VSSTCRAGTAARLRPVVAGRRHAGAGLHRTVACAAGHLFSRTHAGRYFGALWFKEFDERGPC